MVSVEIMGVIFVFCFLVFEIGGDLIVIIRLLINLVGGLEWIVSLIGSSEIVNDGFGFWVRIIVGRFRYWLFCGLWCRFDFLVRICGG